MAMAMAQACSLSDEEAEDLFFDSREDTSSLAYDSCPGSPGKNEATGPEENFNSWAPDDPLYQVWIMNPNSVQERRDKFIRLMGLDLNPSTHKEAADEVVASDEIVPVSHDGELLEASNSIPLDVDRIMSDGGAVLGSSGSEDQSMTPRWSSDHQSMSDGGISDADLDCLIKNLDDGTAFVVSEVGKDGRLSSLRKLGSNQMMTIDEFERNFGSSPFIQQLMRREDNASSNSAVIVRRKRNQWLRMLDIGACFVHRERDVTSSSPSHSTRSSPGMIRRVKVRPHKKQSKELSAVYMRQDFKAHEGPILTMKFSSDGQYLATGGEDAVVRVWHVIELERTDEHDIFEDDPSCIYFMVNENSELAPLHAYKEKKAKHQSMKRSMDSACVVIPPRVFHLSEEPLHEFQGHNAEILDLSWSKNKQLLLSSSIDKTIRLWQVGQPNCLKVFPHSNYVTSVQFNTENDNFFISGSIDGKVRVWEIPRCHVVEWADSKEIVTAVCYRPDGKGIVVGTISGNCRFYDLSDNQLALEAQVSLQGKKKSTHKRITSLQFSPTDPKKLMATSADSQIRILDGVEVVFTYKGLRSPSNQMFASFTEDGHHIVSAGDDSTIRVWNSIGQDTPISDHGKSTWSCECFFSDNASIAIPWNGTPLVQDFFAADNFLSRSASSDSFTPCNLLCSEFALKGGATTWPEEKLLSGSIGMSTLHKSQYKFLKASCLNTSHAWGRVMVTGGRDGRLRSFQNYGLPVQL